MEFSTLEDLSIIVDGRALRLSSPKQRKLTALLLIKPNAVVGLYQIAEEVWGVSPPKSATANIRTYAARLRATLPSVERHRLMVKLHGYGLSPRGRCGRRGPAGPCNMCA